MGFSSHMIWGTPQALALNPRLEQEQIITGKSPGFGYGDFRSARRRNGGPIFRLSVSPAAGTTYWFGGAARAVDFNPSGKAWRATWKGKKTKKKKKNSLI